MTSKTEAKAETKEASVESVVRSPCEREFEARKAFVLFATAYKYSTTFDPDEGEFSEEATELAWVAFWNAWRSKAEEVENELSIAKQRIEALEGAVNWAITVEVTNSESWMRGFMSRVNRVLLRDGDARRCTFDGQQLRLRNVAQCVKD